MSQLYCTIFIVDVTQNPEEVDTITSRIQQLIEDHGGEVTKNNPWGKRRLAYPIEKRTSGFYVEIEFTANSNLNIPKIIEKEYRLNDRVMRYLTYVVTPAELMQRKMDAVRRPGGEMDDDNDNDRPRGGSRGRMSENRFAPIESRRPTERRPAPVAAPVVAAPVVAAPVVAAPVVAAPAVEAVPVVEEVAAPAKAAPAPVEAVPVVEEVAAPAPVEAVPVVEEVPAPAEVPEPAEAAPEEAPAAEPAEDKTETKND